MNIPARANSAPFRALSSRGRSRGAPPLPFLCIVKLIIDYLRGGNCIAPLRLSAKRDIAASFGVSRPGIRPVMRKAVRALLAAAACSCSSLALTVASAEAQEQNPRLFVLTDIGNEPDDSESLVRLLLYTNEIHIEGLVASTSRHHPADPRPDLITRRLDAYAEALPNLRQHDPRYPAADELRQKVFAGSSVYGMAGVGPGMDSDASRAIIAAVDRPDPRPLWVAAWGGAADLAQALWTVRNTRSAEEVARFVSRLRVYTISDQDDAGPWARAYFPELFWITSVHAFTNYDQATWTGIGSPLPGSNFNVVSSQWLTRNIRGIGPMGNLYPLPAYIMEGDTPSFLALISNGLNVSERPDWGGWGGRYGKVSESLGLWAATADSVTGVDGRTYSSPQATIWRWREAFQNDFAARMRWTVSPEFGQANHAPAAVLNGFDGTMPVSIQACPGEPVALRATGSSDPDGQSVTYRWWWYREASGLFAPQLSLSADAGEEVVVQIADTVRTDQFTPPASYNLHVILEVVDDGYPRLTSYRRAIISVPGAAGADEAVECSVIPIGPQHENEM